MARRIVMIVSQSLRAHQRVRRKQAASTKDAILEATMLKPAKMRRAPIREEVR